MNTNEEFQQKSSLNMPKETKPIESGVLDEMVRDFCSVVPRSKSEVRRRINQLTSQTKAERIEEGIKTANAGRKMYEMGREEAFEESAKAVALIEKTQKIFLKKEIKDAKAEGKNEAEKRIGFLRQWLNEDRITDNKKMVTNEEIEHWLFPQARK